MGQRVVFKITLVDTVNRSYVKINAVLQRRKIMSILFLKGIKSAEYVSPVMSPCWQVSGVRSVDHFASFESMTWSLVTAATLREEITFSVIGFICHI